MKRIRVFVPAVLLLVLAAAPAARAQGCQIGGHVETSEDFTPAGGWTTAVQSPGSVLGAPGGPHLVISEVAPRGFGTGAGSDSSEYAEIYNPTTKPVSLTNYYISDDIGYYRIVNGTYPATNSSDFALRFPSGLSLNPGRTLLLCVTKAGYAASGGTVGAAAQHFLEMRDSNGNPADDMIVMTSGSTFPLSGGNLTNPSATNGEWLVLYCWNGISDLVCDVDYASWGATSASNPKMDKTGVSIDGPDAGAAPSSYAPDIAAASQTNLGTVLNKPNSFQRVGGEIGEALVGGNGCRGRVSVAAVDWTTIVDVVRFHIRFANEDPDNSSDPANAMVHAQEFGVFLPNQGLIQQINIPPMQPDSFFDVFFDVPLSALPPSAATELPGGGPAKAVGLEPDGAGTPAAPCPPPTNWNGNLDIVWSGPGYTGQIEKHYGELLICPGADPSYIHVRSSNCPNPAPWTIAGLCPGFTATLVNEDKTPAPNPVPPGWTGWICVQSPAGVPDGLNCCFTVTFTCNGSPAVIDLCATTCDWGQPQPAPTLTAVDWTNVGSDVRFHLRWENTSATGTSVPVSGNMTSQEFGVFLPDFGPIGMFNVPPLAPNSFFDVFFDIPLAQLPPEPPKELPGGGPAGGNPCPPSTDWNGNVDIIWTGQGTGGQVGKHYGDLLICPGAAPSYIHVKSTNCTVGASWTINGLCPGFNATLVNEDKTPAPNPIPPGWTGWICVAAAAATPVGANCCFTVDFDCNGSPASIDLCAITCDWQPHHPTLAAIDWINVGSLVRFHMRWRNTHPTAPSDPVGGTMNSQKFGVFQPDFGPIGSFSVPPIQPNSFFDVFIEIPLAQLPPEPPKELPGGGPPAGSNCPPSDAWNGNVDVIWSGPGGSGQAQKHQGDLLVNLGSTPAYIHVGITNCPLPAPWTITGLCPGFSATLVNEDKTPAPNPIPPGWSGWICVSAAAGVPSGTTCCIKVNFDCGGSLGVIDLCATSCVWQVSGATPVPGSMTFGIFRAAPNPTSSGTVIDFVMPADGSAKVEVFDLSGRRVRTLMDGPAQGGVTSVHWDGLGENGARLSPGAYFVKLTAAGGTSSRKIVLYN